MQPHPIKKKTTMKTTLIIPEKIQAIKSKLEKQTPDFLNSSKIIITSPLKIPPKNPIMYSFNIIKPF